MLASPIHAISSITTDDGAEHVGHIRQEEIGFTADDGSQLLLLRHSLDRLERIDGSVAHRGTQTIADNARCGSYSCCKMAPTPQYWAR